MKDDTSRLFSTLSYSFITVHRLIIHRVLWVCQVFFSGENFFDHLGGVFSGEFFLEGFFWGIFSGEFFWRIFWGCVSLWVLEDILAGGKFFFLGVCLYVGMVKPRSGHKTSRPGFTGVCQAKKTPPFLLTRRGPVCVSYRLFEPRIHTPGIPRGSDRPNRIKSFVVCQVSEFVQQEIDGIALDDQIPSVVAVVFHGILHDLFSVCAIHVYVPPKRSY